MCRWVDQLAGVRSMRQPDGGYVVSRDQYDVVLFDLDGVITNTAKLHAACWKQMFDEYLQKRAGERAEAFAPSILPRITDFTSTGSRVLIGFAIFWHRAVSNCRGYSAPAFKPAPVATLDL